MFDKKEPVGVAYGFLNQSRTPPDLAGLLFVLCLSMGEVSGIREDPDGFGRRSASPTRLRGLFLNQRRPSWLLNL